MAKHSGVKEVACRYHKTCEFVGKPACRYCPCNKSPNKEVK